MRREEGPQERDQPWSRCPDKRLLGLAVCAIAVAGRDTAELARAA